MPPDTPRCAAWGDLPPTAASPLAFTTGTPLCKFLDPPLVHAPILWPIYIGPQQQKEPDGGGDGIWPPPQPLVNVTNILLQNVTSDNGWLNAGVLRCAESNPCRGITFNNVHVSGWASSFYVCENTQGTVTNSTPVPSCMVNTIPNHNFEGH